MSILSALKIEASEDFSVLADNLDVFKSTGTTTNLVVGQEKRYNVMLNGQKFPAFVTLQSANLSRLSILNHENRDGRGSFLVTGVMKNVKIDLDIVIDGTRMSITDVLHQFFNGTVGREIPRDAFIGMLDDIGMRFGQGMPLFFQQFGANKAAFDEAVELFINAGARDVTRELTKQGNIIQAVGAAKGDRAWAGVPVSGFEVGSTNREMTVRKQGFTDFGDAIFESFVRVVGNAKKIALLEKELETNMSGWNQAQIKEHNGKIDEIRKASKQFTSNWGGSQQRIIQQKNGTLLPENTWDPTSVPCGRFTLNVNETAHPINLWTDSRVADTSGQPTQSVSEIVEQFKF